MAMNIEEASAKVIRDAVKRTDEGFKSELYGTKPHVQTVVIITANNPFSNKGTPEWLNRELNERLEAALKDDGYIFKKVLGRYGNLEHTFSVVNMTLEKAVQYASRFHQTSFIIGERKEVNGGRKMNMVYHSWQLSNDENTKLRLEWGQMNAKKLHFSIIHFKKENEDHVLIPNNVHPFIDQIAYPVINASDYSSDEEMFTADGVKYKNGETEDDADNFTRKNSFKFSFPFKAYESVITEAEGMYESAKQKLGKEFDYLYGDHFRNDVSGWKGRRQLMHYINEK